MQRSVSSYVLLTSTETDYETSTCERRTCTPPPPCHFFDHWGAFHQWLTVRACCSSSPCAPLCSSWRWGRPSPCCRSPTQAFPSSSWLCQRTSSQRQVEIYWGFQLLQENIWMAVDRSRAPWTSRTPPSRWRKRWFNQLWDCLFFSRRAVSSQSFS